MTNPIAAQTVLTFLPRVRPLLLASAVALVAFGFSKWLTSPVRHTTAGHSKASIGQVRKELGRLPIFFVENRGQLDARVAYYARGRDQSWFFTEGGVTIGLTERSKDRPSVFQRASLERGTMRASSARRWAVRLEFVGANAGARPVAEERKEGIISYFSGPESEWKTGLPTFSRVVYRDLWPGIDLAYSGSRNRVKYAFVVRPGADPSRIRLRYRGAERVQLSPEGQLLVETGAGAIRDDVPVSYQDAVRGRVEVPTAYWLERNGESFEYGFTLGSYDPSRPLEIDPAVLVYGGFIGGNATDEVTSVAVDASGNLYVAGSSNSSHTTFPVKVGPDLTHEGGYDAFVAKLRADGSALVYAGYIGTPADESAWGIAVDSSGAAYVAGSVGRDETQFPVTVGPDLTYNGGGDGFVAKVRPDGTGLAYCGYIGGSSMDEVYLGRGIAVDAGGNAYVVGATQSTDFPAMVGPDLTFNSVVTPSGTPKDAFIVKVRADGAGFVYAGFIGGAKADIALAVEVDAAGAAYVTGHTESDETTFPVSGGPDVTFNGTIRNAFVTKVRADGTGFVYSGYLGGLGITVAYDIAIDAAGHAYVVGDTNAELPVIMGPDLSFAGIGEGFIGKLKPDGSTWVYLGYIGGSNCCDEAFGVAVDSAGAAYAAGKTTSVDFPLIDAFDTTFGGPDEAYLVKVRPDGTGFEFTTYLGGGGHERAFAVAVDRFGSVYVGGDTSSTEADFPVLLGPDLSQNGATDGFVVKFGTPLHDADVRLTAAGNFQSPPGAFPATAGRVLLSFNARLTAGASAPTGRGQFRFQAAGLDFNTSAYGSLTASGSRAQLEGTGEVNGTGGYQFLLTAIAGSGGGPGNDLVRMKIFNGGGVLYDSQPGAPPSADPMTPLSGGNVRIQQ